MGNGVLFICMFNNVENRVPFVMYLNDLRSRLSLVTFLCKNLWCGFPFLICFNDVENVNCGMWIITSCLCNSMGSGVPFVTCFSDVENRLSLLHVCLTVWGMESHFYLFVEQCGEHILTFSLLV